MFRLKIIIRKYEINTHYQKRFQLNYMHIYKLNIFTNYKSK